MKKIKIVTIVGTRPEIIRLSRIISKLDNHCEHILVHTGQNYDYELNQIFFDDLGIRSPNYFLECAGASPAETMAQVISKSDKLFESIEPEAVLILGDTNSAHWLQFQLNVKRYQYFIWKQVTAALTFEYRKKLTEKLLTIFLMSICLIVTSLVIIY